MITQLTTFVICFKSSGFFFMAFVLQSNKAYVNIKVAKYDFMSYSLKVKFD